MKPIYEPKGKAKEYGDYAINIDSTCPHKCFYCYCPLILHKTKEEFFDYKGHRRGIVEATRRQIEREGITGKLIHLCFVGDPYPTGYDSTPTREIIKLLKTSGNHVQILTKGDGRRDFDLLDSGDWYGVTISHIFDDNGLTWEFDAIAPLVRCAQLKEAHKHGIKTWVSCEPVLCAEDIYMLIERGDYIDRFKIGKLNYHPSNINWHDFGYEAERLCKLYARDYYIKEDLRREMEV
jgi:DNA repair photolyase